MDPRKTRKNAPPPPGEYWGVDPQDVRRHAQRMREARAVGPLDKIFRGAAVALVLVIAFAVYWNFDALRNLRFDFSKITGAFEDAAEEVEDARRGDEPGTEVVGDTSVAGVSLPTSIKGEEPEAQAPAVSADVPDAAAASRETAPAEVAAANETPPPPAPPPEPETPPRPETFGFGLEVMNVSESDAGARVLVLRDGGRRGVSYITWWTTNGTATAGSDFARLEPSTVKFSAGEQNRTLLVPIINDRNVEGPENFSVHVAVGESANAEPIADIEILLADDD
jgi:Calx-beta domain